MSDDQDKLKLSLEPPKLFGRKKKSAAGGTSTSKAKAKPAKAAKAAKATKPDSPKVAEPEEAPEPPEEPTGTDAEETAVIEPVDPEPVDPGPEDATETAVIEPVAPAATEEPEDEDEVAPPTRRPPRRTRTKLAPDIEPEPVTGAELEDAEILAAAEEDDEEPLLTGYPAAAATGAGVGLAMVMLTWLSLRGCEAVRGTASCGGGPGFVLLVATFVVCVLLGSTLLKAFQTRDPGSTSFLAVGVVAVVALLFLIDALDHWSMVVVVPLLSVAGYLGSVWVTRTFVEPGEKPQ